MKTRRLTLLALGLLSILLAAAPVWSADRFPCVVARVIDGDTVICRIGHKNEHVRLIGVDAPESMANEKHFKDARRDRRHSSIELMELGRESTDFITRLIPPGTRVELELDVQERDKYGRLLAYVWRGDTLVNAELLKAGMATVMTIPPNVRRADYFYKLQQQARNRKAGFWR